MSRVETGSESNAGRWLPLLLVIVVSALFASLVLFEAIWLNRTRVRMEYLIHVRWVGEFFAALKEGWVIPRWSYASQMGLGDPAFLYYQPLFYYVAGLFAFVGFAPESATLWAGWLALALTGVVAARSLGYMPPKAGGWLALLLTAGSPALLLLFALLPAFPWMFATPFCLLFALAALSDKPSPIQIGISFALVCLAHILSGMMVVVICVIARLGTFPPSRGSLNGHLRLASGILIGAGLASFYLVPALTLQSLISPNEWLRDSSVDWHRGFAFPTFTFAEYGWRWFGLQVPIPLLTSLMALFTLVATRDLHSGPTPSSAVARRLAIASLVGIVLSTELAYPIYATSISFQRLQNPYRFVVISQIIACVAFATAYQARCARRDTSVWIHGFAAALVAGNLLMTAMVERSISVEAGPNPSYAAVIEGALSPREYLPETSGPDWTTYLAEGGFAAECQRLELGCTSVRGTHFFDVTIGALRPTRVRIPLFAFPAWHVFVDGHPQKLEIDSSTGLIDIELHPGINAVSIRWMALPADVVGRIISIATLVALLGIAWFRTRSRRSNRIAGAQTTPLLR